MKIPTPIPRPLAALAKSVFTGGLLFVLYRLLVIAATIGVLYAVIAGGPGFLTAFIITSVVAAWYMDDITAVLAAIWNADFYAISV